MQLFKSMEEAVVYCRKVMTWKPGAKGLLLVGPTGTGKTGCAWLLMCRPTIATMNRTGEMILQNE